MTKYITIEDQTYLGHQVLDLDKINDEIIPVNRKTGVGADKNIFTILFEHHESLTDFVPDILADRTNRRTSANPVPVRNYFRISSLVNDVRIINELIAEFYSDSEDPVDREMYKETLEDIAEEQGLSTTFYLDAEISNANNGIGFKNWDRQFNSIIKKKLFHNTRVQVHMFHMEEDLCAYWEFGQGHDDVSVDNDTFQEEIQTGTVLPKKRANKKRSSKKTKPESEYWSRDKNVSHTALDIAKFQCENGTTHTTFISAETNNNYMEGHHLIPMGFQDDFKYSLDVESNIVCLCPTCHRMFHSGKPQLKKELITKFLAARKDDLKENEIEIKTSKLLGYYKV